MRVVILGCAGSGKTTLAWQLNERTGARVICLDEIWKPHWNETDVPAFRDLIYQAHAGEEWISDGNFAQATFDTRVPRATLVVSMERSKPLCAWRAIRRVFKPGERHRIRGLAKVLAFIWRFDKINRPRIEALLACHGSGLPVRRLKSAREISDFLSACDVDG